MNDQKLPFVINFFPVLTNPHTHTHHRFLRGDACFVGLVHDSVRVGADVADAGDHL